MLADPKSLERSDTLSMMIVSLSLLKEVVVVRPRVRSISGVGKHVHEHKREGAFRMQTDTIKMKPCRTQMMMVPRASGELDRVRVK